MATNRLIGIDAIRFVCAFVVVLSHYGGPPIFASADVDSIYALKLVSGLYNNLFYGVAAVIVFFVISGLVIHFPYADGKKRNVPEFYLKRYTRILIPMIVASFLDHYLQAKLEYVIWSLYAELIYYTLYPLLLMLKAKVGWVPMIVVAYVFAVLVVVVVDPLATDGIYHSYGVSYTWIIGLPCWLLGAKLAEDIRSSSTLEVTTARIWLMRLTVWIATIALSIAYFHLHLAQTLSLNLFALLVVVWLKMEINYFRSNSAPRWLEYCGLWSYSLYLCHYFSEALLIKFGVTLDHHSLAGWSITLMGSLTFSYVFYLLVESPSHKLARAIKLK